MRERERVMILDSLLGQIHGALNSKSLIYVLLFFWPKENSCLGCRLVGLADQRMVTLNQTG